MSWSLTSLQVLTSDVGPRVAALDIYYDSSSIILAYVGSDKWTTPASTRLHSAADRQKRDAFGTTLFFKFDTLLQPDKEEMPSAQGYISTPNENS